MEKIIVTGISSFIGFHLAKYFSADAYNVIGTISWDLSQYDGIQKVRIAEAANSNVNIEKLDITQSDELINIITKTKPDYWIHHAGWAKNYGSFDYDFVKGFEVNVKPLSTLFSSLKENGCKGIILTGSSAEYSDGNQADSESELACPTMPYGLSKLTETLYARLLAVKYNLPTRVARVYIPFGEFDAPGKLISSVVKLLNRNEPVDLSPCEQKRDFIYIENLIYGYEALLKDFERNSEFDIFNLCSGEATQLKDLLLIIPSILNINSDLLRFGARDMRPGEPTISYGSNKKAKDILGWGSGDLNNAISKYLNNL